MAPSTFAWCIFACKLVSFAIAYNNNDNRPLFQHEGIEGDLVQPQLRTRRQVRTEYFTNNNEHTEIGIESIPSFEEVVAFTHIGMVTLDVTAAVVYTEIDLQPIIDNWKVLETTFMRFTSILYEEQKHFGVASSKTKSMELTLITQRMSRKLRAHWELIEETETLGQAQGVNPGRGKRSPLHVALAFASAISGIVSSVATSQVLAEQGKLVDHLIEDQSQFSRAVPSEAPEAESVLSYLNDTIDSLKHYVAKENKEGNLKNVYYYDDKFTFFHDLLLYCQLIESHMSEYMVKTNRYLRALLNSFKGNIDTAIFSPSAVREALEDLDQAKPDTLTMLFGSSNRDVSSFFRMKSTLVRTPTPNTFRIGVLLPLCNQMEQYDLFSVSAAPISKSFSLLINPFTSPIAGDLTIRKSPETT